MVLVFNLVLGAFRGAIWQILRVASIVLGIWAAIRYSQDFLALWPSSLGLDPEAAPLVSQVVVFLSVYLVMYGVTNLVKGLVDKIKLGWLDRWMGAVIGVLKGCFFCAVVLYLQFTPLGNLGAFEDQLYGNPDRGLPPSTANRFFLQVMKERIDQVVPDDVKSKVHDMRDDFERRLVEPRPK